MAVTYVVETTVNPGVQYEVSQAEYQRLLELGLLLNGPSGPVAPGVFDTEVSALLDDVNSQTYGKVAAFPPGPHTHTASQISDSGSTGRALLATTSALSARAAISAAQDTHTHGIADLTAIGTKDDTTFLRGDGTWSVPPGGTVALADLPAGSVVYINQNGDSSWPNRPTARTDIKVVGTMVVPGSSPPATATSPAVNGLYVTDIVVRT